MVSGRASSHTAPIARHRLSELFPQRIVSLHHDVEWPPRSPDLMPLDFFLWGYIKSRVYQPPPADLEGLRRRIGAEFVELRRTRMTRHAMTTMVERAARCLNKNGEYFEGRGGHN